MILMKYQATWMVQRQKLPLEDIFFINYGNNTLT